ncbi:hypothetical protein ceV_492 [Chrysochromulina ericina virus CeV-01B]|uniref:Uncharacterized protein n=1 Tax=Chrysochromulina ericina virus CeV-01B TaxID=3070830 RepID=A0A0N9QJK0_9VIRU|nr:hypothetical protein ceV_492 [Chrysochromulina ericina virus]ALH23398.1 hypothetical protein ceV_492 [Chrysochromulina ericina virus CeV-01B]
MYLWIVYTGGAFAFIAMGIFVAQGVYSPPVTSIIDYYLNKTVT